MTEQALRDVAPPANVMAERVDQIVLQNGNIVVWTEDAVRAALNQEVKRHCCWSAAPAAQMQIVQMRQSSSWHCKVTSFVETRAVMWTVGEPYRGGPIDGADRGPPPNAWDVLAEQPQPFQEKKQVLQVPRTEMVQPCQSCKGQGRSQCGDCGGRGSCPCSHCAGRGHNRCGSCSAHDVDCNQCDGRGFAHGCGAGHDNRQRCPQCAACDCCKGSGKGKGKLDSKGSSEGKGSGKSAAGAGKGSELGMSPAMGQDKGAGKGESPSGKGRGDAKGDGKGEAAEAAKGDGKGTMGVESAMAGPCASCGDYGWMECGSCRGEREKACGPCSGGGTIDCRTCQGHGQMRAYQALTITWSNKVAERIIQEPGSSLDVAAVRAAAGPRWEVRGLPVQPAGHLEPAVNAATSEVCQEAMVHQQDGLLRLQELMVKQVPVCAVSARHGGRDFGFTVYGEDHRVVAPDYPSKCCGCSIL